MGDASVFGVGADARESCWMNIFIANWRCPRSPRSGGAEHATQRIVEGLVRMGHQVTWFSSWSAGLEKDEVRNGVRYLRRGNEVTCRFYCGLWLLHHQSEFHICIDEINTIPFYLHWYTSIPSVTYIHQLAGPVWLFEAPPIVGRVGMLLERWLLWAYRFRPIVAGSKSTLDELRAFGHRGPSNVIGYGLDAHPVAPVKYRVLPMAKCRIVMVSRITPSKRIDHGIEVVRWLAYSSVDAELHIVGIGSIHELERLRRLALETGCSDRIRFHGWLGSVAKAKVVAESFVIISTSVKEGWQLTISEAHLLGVPSVVYPVTGLIDSTQHGRNGIISEREHPHAIAEDIIKLWNNSKQYNRLRVNAQHTAKRLSWPPVITSWHDTLSQYI